MSILTPKQQHEVNKIDYYEKWYKTCREFIIWFDGYTRNDTMPKNKLINLIQELEILIFGERITHSWI